MSKKELTLEEINSIIEDAEKTRKEIIDIVKKIESIDVLKLLLSGLKGKRRLF